MSKVPTKKEVKLMLNPEEFTPGCLVYNTRTKKVRKLTKVDPKYMQDLQPVPITEKVLDDLGLNREEGTDLFSNHILKVKYLNGKCGIFLGMWTEVQYAHNLQVLYLCLTGTKLEPMTGEQKAELERLVKESKEDAEKKERESEELRKQEEESPRQGGA